MTLQNYPKNDSPTVLGPTGPTEKQTKIVMKGRGGGH